MDPYKPINCNFYDLIEHYAVRRQVVAIRYQLGDGEEQMIESRILDTQTTEAGEFVILEKEGLKLRMDYLIAIDAVTL